MTLKTHQTGPAGRLVKRLLIEEGADVHKEFYVGMVVDRRTQRVALMASSEGGMEIEEVAARTPEKIHKVFIDPGTGLKAAEADGRNDREVPEAFKLMLRNPDLKAILVNTFGGIMKCDVMLRA